MKKLNLKKIITMGLITTSILVAVPVGASAEWKRNSNGWWYTKANNTYAIGWEKIGNAWYYFDSTGYMKSGWVKSGSDWYFLKNDGTMATGTILTDGQISSFTSTGVWNGYIANNQASSNATQASNNNSSNTSTINRTNNQTTTTSDSFTFEDAKAEVMRTMTEGFYGGYIIPYDKIEVTKGGYNGLPVEDKVYTYTDNILGKTFTYRIVGIIDKTTGFFAGTATVFKDMEYWEASGRGDYELCTDSRNPNVKINQKTFDKKGDWITAGYEPIYQTTALTDQQKLKRQQDEEANIKAMHPDWVTH